MFYSTGNKCKPSTVTDYNQSKYGVDVVDQMARNYTCKLPSRRWPVQVGTSLYTCVTGTILLVGITHNQEWPSSVTFLERFCPIIKTQAVVII